MNKYSKILGVKWFAGSIGVARVKGMNNFVKYYIGYTDCSDKREAKIEIARYGVTYPKKAGDVLFKIKKAE